MFSSPLYTGMVEMLASFESMCWICPHLMTIRSKVSSLLLDLLHPLVSHPFQIRLQILHRGSPRPRKAKAASVPRRSIALCATAHQKLKKMLGLLRRNPTLLRRSADPCQRSHGTRRGTSHGSYSLRSISSLRSLGGLDGIS